ncbi:prepilin peptidase [Paenibacillus phocaensis]|uniref:prepilin peptidase n=1 Tax=Paenibacillus phocaensis TaxID=1776378 RepID=UPI000839B46F|nr:A24 family peptidase [Paenibacillus phocaensis]
MNNLLESILLLIILGIATYTDLRYRIIPDWLSGIGIGYFLIFRLFHNEQPFYYYLLGVLIGAGLLYIFAVLKTDSFGGGDIKLMAAVGMALGWQQAMLFLMIMLTFACLFAIIFKWAGEMEKLPLAPFYLMAYFLFIIGGI